MRIQLLMALALFAGCAHKQTQASTTEPAPASVAPAAAKPVARALPPGPCSHDAQCQPNELCVDGRCADAATLPECASLRVHFDFDKSDLRAEDQQRLDRFQRCLKAQANATFIVEGNCDERGTEEYNLALGDRRANAVIAYLTALGAKKEQLRTVSYGELRPLCGGHEESCWWQNRRADLQKSTAQASR